jgi:hypothetical protein
VVGLDRTEAIAAVSAPSALERAMLWKARSESSPISGGRVASLIGTTV